MGSFRLHKLPRLIALGQGLFYLLSGIWPILHLRSFIAVTGPKTDLWLVQTMGALLAVLGLALLGAARRPRIEPEWRFLGGASASVLGGADVIFVQRHVIAPIYLADAAAELLIVVAWIACALTLRGPGRNRLSGAKDTLR